MPGGHTTVKIGGEFLVNETREFVVDGGVRYLLVPWSSILDGGYWEPILIYG